MGPRAFFILPGGGSSPFPPPGYSDQGHVLAHVPRGRVPGIAGDILLPAREQTARIPTARTRQYVSHPEPAGNFRPESAASGSGSGSQAAKTCESSAKALNSSAFPAGS